MAWNIRHHSKEQPRWDPLYRTPNLDNFRNAIRRWCWYETVKNGVRKDRLNKTQKGNEIAFRFYKTIADFNRLWKLLKLLVLYTGVWENSIRNTTGIYFIHWIEKIHTCSKYIMVISKGEYTIYLHFLHQQAALIID